MNLRPPTGTGPRVNFLSRDRRREVYSFANGRVPECLCFTNWANQVAVVKVDGNLYQMEQFVNNSVSKHSPITYYSLVFEQASK